MLILKTLADTNTKISNHGKKFLLSHTTSRKQNGFWTIENGHY